MVERDIRAAGPLRNLASHVPADWWRTLFGALYLRTDGDVVEDDRLTAQEVDVLVAAAALSHRHRILDLCCGQGRHALELARRGFDHVTGLDHSSFLVQLAWQRAAASALRGTAYTGAPPSCLAVCHDKSVVRGLALALNVPVPTEIRLLCDHSVTASLDYPLFVKPARADGSFGIGSWSVADNRQSLLAAVDRLKHQHGVSDIVVQEFLSGREYTVGIIGNVESGLTVLPIIEVDYSTLPSGPHFQCHNSKWDASSSSWTGIRCCKAEIGEAEARHMENAAVALFGALGCRDYARFDFRAGTDGVIRLLEVNPNSSWCWDGKMAIMAGVAGMSYPGMLQAILDCAWRRTQ